METAEGEDRVPALPVHHQIQRLRTLLGRVSEQGPQSAPSLDLGPLDPPSNAPETQPLLPSPSYGLGTSDNLLDLPGEDCSLPLRPGIVDPSQRWYRVWSAVVLLVAGSTGFITPWQIAFSAPRNLYSLGSLLVWVDLLFSIVFGADVYLTTFVAYRDATDSLVDEHHKILLRYQREGTLYTDMLGMMPLDLPLVLLLGGPAAIPPAVLSLISLLRLFHLARLVRLIRLFSSLEYDTRLSLLWVTMARNLSLLAYMINWFACGFQFVTRQLRMLSDGVAPETQQTPLGTVFGQYLGSLYWAVETLTSPQFGNEAPRTRWELAAATARIGLFMAYDIAIGAYIMGTISLLVVKADERTGDFRDRAANLKQFVQQHAIPKDLRESMQEHLALHFQNEEASDESVLAVYPTTLRRRILRHLYGKFVQDNYLFQGARQKFLDALLAACRIELYMPNVDILTEGEAVNELCLVVEGTVEVVTTTMDTSDEADSCYDQNVGAAKAPANNIKNIDNINNMSELRASRRPTSPLSSTNTAIGGKGSSTNGGGSPRTATLPLNPIGGQGWLTDGSVADKSMPSAANYTRQGSLIERDSPSGNGVTFASSTGNGVTCASPRGRHLRRGSSLKRQLGVMKDDALAVRELGPGNCFGEIAFFTEIPQHEVVRSLTVCRVLVVSRESYNGIVASFPMSARSVLLNLQRAIERAVLDAFPTLKQSQSFVRMLRHSPSTLVRHTAGGCGRIGASDKDDSAHYDGEREWQQLLSGPLTARQAALVGNLHRTRNVVMEHTSKTDAERVTQFLYACSLGHINTVRKMLQQGFPADEADYDGRTGLMLACVKANESIVRELLSAGVDPLRPDAMGTCALLEAVNNGHDGLISLLTKAGARLSRGGGTVLDAVRLCTCVFECDLPRLRRLLRAGCPVDAADYDLRTALHICAAEGNLAMVRMLVDEGHADIHKRDRWGNTPLHEAMHIEAHQVVDFLRERLADRGLPQDRSLLEDTAPPQAASGKRGSMDGGDPSGHGRPNLNGFREHTSRPAVQGGSRRYSLFRRLNSAMKSSLKTKAGGYGR